MEVLSTSNSKHEMTTKRHRYFEAGTEQFWLVYPEERIVEFYFSDGRTSTATGDVLVECEGVAEGALRFAL